MDGDQVQSPQDTWLQDPLIGVPAEHFAGGGSEGAPGGGDADAGVGDGSRASEGPDASGQGDAATSSDPGDGAGLVCKAEPSPDALTCTNPDQEYQQTYAELKPKLDTVTTREFLTLAPQLNEIVKLKAQMLTLAQSGKYDQALPMVATLAAKVDAYLAAADKQVDRPIIGTAQNERADTVLKKMSADDQKAVGKLLDTAKSEPEKQFIRKGVAASHTVAELKAFAKKIQGKDAKWMRDNLSLTGSSTGRGVEQQWSHSCNATMVEAVHGEMDPLYALKMHEDSPKLDTADPSDGKKANPKLAEDQKAMLTSNYKGGSGGAAVARTAAGGSGRWADDLLNNMSGVTGTTYTTKKMGEGATVDGAMKAIDNGLSRGEPVPLVIGNSSTSYTHYVLVTGSDKGPPKSYSIHDPWSGSTVVRTEAELKDGTLDIANSNQITAYEEPAEVQPQK